MIASGTLRAPILRHLAAGLFLLAGLLVSAPRASASTAAAAKPAEHASAGEHKAAHHEGPPELPNLAEAIGAFAPETRVGKFLGNHNNWWVVRPFFALLMVLIFVLLLTGVYKKRSVHPGRLQTAVEMVVEALDNLICGILGRDVGRAYLPFLGGLFVYIMSLNLFGLFPLAMSPTSFYATTGALAVCTVLVTQYTAFTKLGVKGVVLHWLGNPEDGVTWAVGFIILLPLHIVEDFIVKPVSLAARLYGNIFGEDVLLGAMLSMGVSILVFLPKHGIPVGLPLELPFMFLALLTSTIQALVFSLLSTIYVLMVLPHEDHDEHHEAADVHA